MKLDPAIVDDIIDEAIKRINSNIFGSYLLERFPMRKTSTTVYPDINAVLRQHGSPACTDGAEVYIEPTILGNMLAQDYYALDFDEIKGELDELYGATRRERMWKAKVSDRKMEPMLASEMVEETKGILLHELTHAFNEHNKIRIAAKENGVVDTTRLDIACELQANDGIMGETYEMNRTQTLKGVTNKRLHPETIGKHTLKGLYDAIQLNEEEKERSSNAHMQAALREKISKLTGQYERDVREVKERQAGEGKGDKSEQKAKASATDNKGDDTNGKQNNIGFGGDVEFDTDTKVIDEVQKRGADNVKEIILASLSDELRYDATTDSVIFDKVSKRRCHATYARPSRRIGAMGISDNQLLRKGVKYTREYEYNKSRKLTVLAVDGSGSMHNQQRYVAAILDDLLRQVEAVAKEYNVEVHYENLQATIHRTRCSEFVPASSDAWKQRMREYRAGGGNKFMAVLESTNKLLKNNSYDAITIINVSDGLDRLDDTGIMNTGIGRYINDKKVKWVDALVSSNMCWLKEAMILAKEDTIKIREQVLLAANLER